MNTRKLQRKIDNYLYNNSINKWTLHEYGWEFLINSLPRDVLEAATKLAYSRKQVYILWQRKQSEKKPGGDPRVFVRSRNRTFNQYQGKTKNRYYSDKRKKTMEDKPPHLRALRLSVQYGEYFINGQLAKLKEKPELEPRKEVAYGACVRKSKIHLIKEQK